MKTNPNDSANPIVNEGAIVQGGLTKREIFFKDIVAKMAGNPNMIATNTFAEHEYLINSAMSLTSMAFAKLNEETT